ncbi:MAG: hypothetical protein GC179_22320 [Anaerolineaceae bacterium]|nr:hypothetical protein [Anaerolineaceae bacterium]
MTKSFPIRRSPRLQGYDYSQEGAYFVTICTHGREHQFGVIQDGEFNPSAIGTIAFEDWQMITSHYPSVELDLFVVMPNHVHGIVFLVGAEFIPPAANQPSPISKYGFLSQVIAGYKAGVTRRVNKLDNPTGRINPAPTKIWQRSFHDHIIRNDGELNRIREYVMNNPKLWEQDRFYG